MVVSMMTNIKAVTDTDIPAKNTSIRKFTKVTYCNWKKNRIEVFQIFVFSCFLSTLASAYERIDIREEASYPNSNVFTRKDDLVDVCHVKGSRLRNLKVAQSHFNRHFGKYPNDLMGTCEDNCNIICARLPISKFAKRKCSCSTMSNRFTQGAFVNSIPPDSESQKYDDNVVIHDEICKQRGFVSLEHTADNNVVVCTSRKVRRIRFFLAIVIAWVVVLVTLEVNDFSHHLMATYDDTPSSYETSRRYIASLIAIQYGMYDAVIDWMITYTVSYAIIGGITWYNADASYLAVILGFSFIISALILAAAGLKMPEWFGLYRMSQLKTIRDTSGFAAKAVEDLFSEGSTIAAFRYQARLGVGKHFTQFFWLLLPFYVNLKFWFYLLSVFVGFVIGQLFIFIVFKCRERFKRRRRSVAIGASAVVSIGSAIAFTRGVEIVNIGWNRGIGKSHVILPICFFVWLAAIGLFHGWKYFEHRNFDTDTAEPLLFADSVNLDGDVKHTIETVAEGVESTEDAFEEPLLGLEASSGRRDVMKKGFNLDASGQGYFYQTAYFDRIRLKQPHTSLTTGSDDVDENENIYAKQVYKTVAASEDLDAGVKWYHRVWRFLPFTAIWGLSLVGTRDMYSCCARSGTETKSEFKEMSCGKKSWFVFRKIVKLFFNILCFLMAIIACGDAHQTEVTKSKLPWVQSIYRTLNIGQVCAYDTKCGNIETFDSVEAAHAANYSVAHCGKCSGCSTWQDLSVQWTTRKKAAALSQSCGIRYLFDQHGMAECMARDMGLTAVCSEAWVHSVVCARENCNWITLRTAITNRMGNFQMQKTDVTPATCNEAQCEQGNPGNFAKLSGASRRKMNIRSSIAREPDQQCQIVDNIPRDAEGRYNDWGPFFEEPCPRSDSPP